MIGDASYTTIRFLARKIKNAHELIKEYPQYKDEYLDEATEYSKILYHIIKEVISP
jgi:hypothetical protein